MSKDEMKQQGIECEFAQFLIEFEDLTPEVVAILKGAFYSGCAATIVILDREDVITQSNKDVFFNLAQEIEYANPERMN